MKLWQWRKCWLPTFLCRFGVLREQHSEQGRNFEPWLVQDLQRLGVSKTPTTPLHSQSDCMVELWIKAMEKDLRKLSHHTRGNGAQDYPSSSLPTWHDTTILRPANLVFGSELRLPCDLLFGTPPDKDIPTLDHAENLVDHLHDIHNYGRQHLKLDSDRIKTRYNRPANYAGYIEDDDMRLFGPTSNKVKSAKLHSQWEGPYRAV
jgi:hypothetical protein